ncbi:MAG: hypothetical protein GY856_19685, partial [bacterium]|nr:hypothetical protein [bacterium]
MSRYFSLGRDGEAQWERLRRSYELVRRRAVVIATSPDRKVLSECRRRLADLSPKLLRAVPDQRVVETIHDLAAQHLEKKNLPVVWLESEGDRLSADELNEAWRHALSSLNVARERLADRGPVFLVLAGPPELLDLVGRRSPDLWSVANPVVHLGETLEDLVEGATTIDWLHLSDLHVRDPADWRHDVVVDQLRRDLPKLLDDAGLSPALVFVTGDLAWSGQKGELDQAHTFLKELLASLDLNPLHDLYAVPGNHDVDREAIGRMVRRDQAAVLELADEQFRGEVGEVLGNPADLALYGARLSAWCDFTGSLVGAARRVTPDRPWRTDIHPLGGLRVGIASLCSAWSCGPDDDRSGRIMLGERQVRTALDELRSAHLRLVLLHHPLEWLHDAERQAITGLLRSEAHAILHGHLHVAETVRTVGAAGELAVLASGAAYAGTGWKHGFQVARLDPAAAELAVHCFTWSERDGGFWHPDPGAARGAENGVVRLRLSVNTVAARGPASPAAGEGLAARLARAAAAVHGQLGFIGLPDHAPKPNAGLTDLFVPVSFTEEHGDEKEAWSLAELQAD